MLEVASSVYQERARDTQNVKSPCASTSCMHSECKRQKHCQNPLSLRTPERQKCSLYVQQHCVASPFQDIEESWLPCALHQAKTTRKGNHFSRTTATDFLWVCVHTCQETRPPTCRDHVEKQTQKSPEPCSGKCVAVTQRPHAISAASARHLSCIVGLVVRDTAEHMTSRVSKQGARTTRQ